MAIDTHQCLCQLQEIYKDGTSKLLLAQLDTLETIDMKLTIAKLEAERQCRKIHAGRIPWMPGLTIAIYKLLYWQGIKKWITRGQISGDVLRKRARQGAETFTQDHLQLQVVEVQEKIKQATQDYKTIKKASDRRDTWLGQMILAQAEDKNITKKRLWLRIRQTEQSWKTSRSVKKALGTMTQHAGLTQVTAPTEEELKERTCYTTKVNIEQACLAEAKRRFTQANDTPMLQQPMTDIFGIDNMDSPAFEQILAGTFQCPAECNKYVHKLIEHMKRPQELPPITMRTYEEYKQSWELTRETTASLPSQVHFGHYIAGIAKDMVGKLNTILANVRLLSGTAPKRWKQTLNVMLEKLAGNDNVEKLRIIMLFEVDFNNNNNKWIGRVMMQLVGKTISWHQNNMAVEKTKPQSLNA